MRLDEFMKSDMRASFLECALWATCDDGGNPLDDRFCFEDVSEEALDRAARVVTSFLHMPGVLETIERLGLSDESVGHDLFLSANGHGVGFWARGYGEDGDALHEATELIGSFDLYVGDDGLVYVF